MNRLDKIDEKLDIIIEKVSRMEVHVETTKSELKVAKETIKEHEKDMNKLKGALLLISLLGLFGAIKTYLHLN